MKIRDRIVDLRRVPAATLLPNPKNWRRHPKAQADALRGLLSEIGYADALIARETPDGLQLIDGHLRAETTPDAEVPVLVLDVNEEEADKLLLSLDPLAAMAEGDAESLRALLAQVETDSDAVRKMLDALAKEYSAQPGPKPLDDPGPKYEEAEALRKKWNVEPGQLWLLGDHRLLCGDSTNVDDVTRLMNGERAILFATDPPYLVGYDGTNHPGTKTSENRPSLNTDWSKTYGKKWDEADAAQNSDLYERFIKTAVEVAILPHAAWYCWHASRRQRMVEEAWEKNGAFVHQQIIWSKPNRPILTRSWYLWSHEPCFFGWMKGMKPPKETVDYGRTVWEIDSITNDQRPDHPTPKPLDCFAIPMRQHTKAGDLCYEPFSGSGTQIIAGEREGRRVYAMEISPAYVAVTLERWAESTGGTPRIAEEGS
ncbi:MAG: DNA methyltransferase [Acidobacteriota bacterium]